MNESAIQLIPAFDDNYIFLGRKNGSSSTFVVDPGDAIPVINFLKKENLNLGAILITHEHNDHIGGVLQLAEQFPDCRIIGSPEMKAFLPGIETRFEENRASDFKFDTLTFKVFLYPGHTKNHYAYYMPNDGFLFSGDVLFGLGCGRIFSGTHADQFATLGKINQLPDSTKVFCAHEYTHKNLDFLLEKNQDFPDAVKIPESQFKEITSFIKITLDNRLNNEHATVPLNLGFEKKYSPFLKCRTYEDFKTLRDLRDKF